MIGRMKERAKLVRPLLVPLMFYIGFLAFSFSWLEENQGSSWRITVALLPMLPRIFIALGIGKAIQQLDEMERIILQKGMAISFAATLLLLITMGLLKTAGIEQLGSTYIVLFMIIVWLLAKLWGHWRYQ